MSSVELDTKMSKIMELGLNCHLTKKYNHNRKLIEIEKLFENVLNQEKNNYISIDNTENLKTELKYFGIQKKVDHTKDILTKDDYITIENFLVKNEIIIRKADKSNSIVIVDKPTYLTKINNILSNTDKFKKIKKTNIMPVKKKINSIIVIGLLGLRLLPSIYLKPI